MLGNPARDSLAYAELESVDSLRMGVFGRPQHQFAVFQDVNKAGIARYNGCDKLHHILKNAFQRRHFRDARRYAAQSRDSGKITAALGRLGKRMWSQLRRPSG